MAERSETDIQRVILAALRATGIPSWRTNATARSYRMASNPGFPDIVGIVPDTGQFLAIEVKRPGGRQSPEQLEFQATVERSNGLYIVAESLDDVIPIIHSVNTMGQPEG
jgi:hypothetical protein